MLFGENELSVLGLIFTICCLFSLYSSALDLKWDIDQLLLIVEMLKKLKSSSPLNLKLQSNSFYCSFRKSAVMLSY